MRGLVINSDDGILDLPGNGRVAYTIIGILQWSYAGHLHGSRLPAGHPTAGSLSREEFEKPAMKRRALSMYMKSCAGAAMAT